MRLPCVDSGFTKANIEVHRSQMVSDTRTQTQASRTRKPEFVSWLNCRPPANAGLMESETQFLTALQLLKLE